MRAALGGELETLWAKGQLMGVEEAIIYTSDKRMIQPIAKVLL